MRKKMQRKEPLEIVHALPGRVRFRFKSEKVGIPDLNDFLKISGVKEVTFNKITKSLLIIYDRRKLNLEKLILEIQERMPGFEISKAQLREDENDAPSGVPSDDLLSEMIYNVVAGANRSVALKTKHQADLSSIIPFALVLLGAGEIIRRPVMPHWYDFWWYSYNILWQNYTSKHPNFIQKR